MKRLFSLLLILLFVPLFAYSEGSPQIISHYSMAADFRPYSTGKGSSPFYIDGLMLDIYFTDSNVVYFWSCECIKGEYIASGVSKRTVVERDGIMYIVKDSGYYLTAWYDENGTDLWISYDDHFYRLHPVPLFSVYEDWQ